MQTLLLSSKPINATVSDNGVEISIDVAGEVKEFQCRLLCGADGAHSWVRRTFKMGRPKELMIGFQIEVTGYPGEEGRLDLFTGDDIAPDSLPGLFRLEILQGYGRHGLYHKLSEGIL